MSARIAAFLLVLRSARHSPEARGAGASSLAPGSSHLVRAQANASGIGRRESELCEDGPFWPEQFLHPRSLQPLGREVVVSAWPAAIEFDVLCALEADEPCDLRIVVSDAGGQVVGGGQPVRPRLRPLGVGETLQPEKLAIVLVPTFLSADRPGQFTVSALLNGVPAATVGLVVRRPAS